MGLYFLKTKIEAFWNSKHTVSTTTTALNGTWMPHGVSEQMFMGRTHSVAARCKQALKHCSLLSFPGRDDCPSPKDTPSHHTGDSDSCRRGGLDGHRHSPEHLRHGDLLDLCRKPVNQWALVTKHRCNTLRGDERRLKPSKLKSKQQGHQVVCEGFF